MMTPATACALLLMTAGFLHSFSFMCRKLPAGRKPAFYPRHARGQLAIDLCWVVQLAAGVGIAFALSPWLGVTAVFLYFLALPFVFQLPLARMLGFRSYREYLETVTRER